MRWRVASIFALGIFGATLANAGDDVSAVYLKNCAECHHPKRLGLSGPPLIPDFLAKSPNEKIIKTIREGLPATKMPSFADKLTGDQISQLAEYVKSPAQEADWTANDIANSRNEYPKKEISDKAPKETDLDDITLVMERGTKSLAVLSPKTFDVIARFDVGAVHGGPKFTHGLKNIYALSRDGFVTRFDLATLNTQTTARAGISSRMIAVSGDDKTIAVANNLPQNIVFLNDNLAPVSELRFTGKTGGFYSMPWQRRFILSFRDIPELWVIKDSAPFTVEKIALPEAFEDFSISPVDDIIIGNKRDSDWLYVYDFKNRKIISKLPVDGMPHLASAAFWRNDRGGMMVGLNHIKKPSATIYSLVENKAVAEIKLPGAGFFMRTHYASPYLWIDTETDKIALVDKNDFSKIRYITPHEGKKAMHVEFDKDGARALVSIPGKDGEVVIYDANTLEKIKTLPFDDPAGKYNATNKTYPDRVFGQAKKNDRLSAGKEVFESYCMGCHHQEYDAFGPPFRQIAATRTAEQIRYQILSPAESSRKLGYEINSMPVIKLSGEQMESIIDYIQSYK